MINPFKVWWATWGWQLKAISIAVVIGIILIGVVFYKACSKPPKLNTVEIQKAQKAIAEQDRREMIEVLAQSDAREKEADATAIEANTVKVNAIAESKAKWANASNEEMAAELERRAKESQ